MRIALRTSGGRGEYELAGRQGPVGVANLFDLDLRFELTPEIRHDIGWGEVGLGWAGGIYQLVPAVERLEPRHSAGGEEELHGLVRQETERHPCGDRFLVAEPLVAKAVRSEVLVHLALGGFGAGDHVENVELGGVAGLQLAEPAAHVVSMTDLDRRADFALDEVYEPLLDWSGPHAERR